MAEQQTSGSGPRFTRQEGIVAPMLLHNVNTDVIAPLGKPPYPGVTPETRAFEPIRFLSDGRENPNFVLNQEQFRRASIILAGKNFGTGSSRPQAVTRPLEGGINVVIAESFGPLFYDNSVRLGLLAIPLEKQVIEELAAWTIANPGKTVLVDLESQTIQLAEGGVVPFAIEPRVREKLLNGYDELEEVSKYDEEITTFAEIYRNTRPWIYESNIIE